MVVQLGEALRRKREWVDRDLTARKKLHVPEAPIGRHHLVLRADGFFEKILLDVDAFQGQLPLAGHLALKRIGRMQEANGKGRARSHSAASRKVAVVVDF